MTTNRRFKLIRTNNEERRRLFDQPLESFRIGGENYSKIGVFTPTPHYNVNRYDWAYRAWKQQNQVFWLPEEVPLHEDAADFAVKLSEDERRFVRNILTMFTQSDVEVNRRGYGGYLRAMDWPLEIQMAMDSFKNIETIHMASYALLNETLGFGDESFSDFLQIPEMMSKIELLESTSWSTPRDLAVSIATFGAFAEGLQLFGSFSMLMNLSRFNKMKGMGIINEFSSRDETIHTNTMVTLFHAILQEFGVKPKELAEKIYDVADAVMERERAFVMYVFQNYNIDGTNAHEIISFLEFMCDVRLTMLGIRSRYCYFDKHGNELRGNPVPWTNEVLFIRSLTNFFEARSAEYSKSAMTGSWPRARDAIASYVANRKQDA